MNIKPGSVNQQPLYGCTGCYEDYTWPAWPAGDLRVYDNECWCGQCWAERRWLFPDQPYWDDLEPYTPAEQQPAPDVSGLVEALETISEIDYDTPIDDTDTVRLWAACDGIRRAKLIAVKALAARRKQGGDV